MPLRISKLGSHGTHYFSYFKKIYLTLQPECKLLIFLRNLTFNDYIVFNHLVVICDTLLFYLHYPAINKQLGYF